MSTSSAIAQEKVALHRAHARERARWERRLARLRARLGGADDDEEEDEEEEEEEEDN